MPFALFRSLAEPCPRRTLLASSLLACAALGTAAAQYDTASVLGFVRDTSGAAIPKSTVSLIDTQTGRRVTVASDAQGQFNFTDVHVGQYQVDATAPGFSESLTSPFSVAVNARQRVDVQLQVGKAAETVTVSGAASALESESSESGVVIEPTEVHNLPLNGRAYADLTTLAPGVRRNNLENQSVTSRDASFNVNGQRSEFNNFLLDGLDNNAYGTSNQGFSNQNIPPSPDAINEFRVETNNYSAEYGRASGAVINVSINSGTNKFHGVVYEYNRNTSFNAIGPFLPPVNAITGKVQKPVLIRNQFGGTLGGPIRRDKTFFFVDFEGNRQVQGQYSAVTIPNANQRAGIFRTTTGAPVPLRNPITGTLYPDGVVPQTDWTPLAKLVIADLPAPNVPNPNAFANNYVSVPKANLVDNKGDARVDHYFSPKTTAFARYSEHDGNIVDAASIPGPAGGGSSNGTIYINNKQVAAALTHSFTQGSILDARIGFDWTHGGKSPYGANLPSLLVQAGVTGLPTNPLVVRSLNPQAVTGFTQFGSQGSSPQFQNPFVIDPKVNYTILHGRNSIKTGWEFLSINTEVDDFNPTYGQDGYSGAFSQNGGGTKDAGASQAAYLADFLVGARNSYQLNNIAVVNYHQYMNFFYVQDDLKLSPKFTANLGLRYELVTPQFVSSNHLANFDPATNTLVQARSGSIFDRALVHTPKLDFAPRLGFAYLLDDKTVIRGAYGISFDQFNREGGENLLAYNGPSIVNSQIQQYAPFSTGSVHQPVCTPGAALTGCFRPVSQGYPDNFASPANFNTQLAQTRYIPAHIPTGYVQAWHLDVQREIAPRTTLTVSYVGEHGVHIAVLADLNQAAPCPATGPCASLLARRPIQGFTGIEESVPYGFLSYNALQTKLEHSYSNGLYLLNSFTYSRAIDNASGHLDTPNGDNSRVNLANLNGERGESAYDQPLNDTLTLIYDLPYGHGRHFGANASRWAQGALGGWQFSAVNTATSGQPVNLTYSIPASRTVSTLLNYRPNVSGDPVGSRRTKTATAVTGYLNPNTVSVPTDPSTPYGNAGRNSLRSYAFYQVDAALHKGFPLWSESSLLDLRLEAFNALNQTNYGPPDSNRSNSSFGTITQAYPARQLQVAARLSF